MGIGANKADQWNVPGPEEALPRVTANLEYFGVNYAICVCCDLISALVGFGVCFGYQTSTSEDSSRCEQFDKAAFDVWSRRAQRCDSVYLRAHDDLCNDRCCLLIRSDPCGASQRAFQGEGQAVTRSRRSCLMASRIASSPRLTILRAAV